MRELTIVHLYPDLLRTYGDRGNILALARRAQARGIDARVAHVSRGEALPADARIVLLGGGSDRIQEIVGPDLHARRSQLADLAAAGTIVLGVCGGYQFLGHSYTAVDGTTIDGLGLLDVTTVAAPSRIIGRTWADATPDDATDGRAMKLYGFENHAGRTHLGPGARALARTPRGHGNNGEDGTEGAIAGSILGTYLHGPLLPLNPELADWIVSRALGGIELTPIDDAEESAARAARARLPR
jgi:CobQ-like glutamine amidotransferase family enzyme